MQRVASMEITIKKTENWARIPPGAATIDLQYPSFRPSMRVGIAK